MAENHDLFEIMRTTRSMRRLKPDPVPDALLAQILEAGTCAASGGNSQNWRFLLVRDPAVKAAAGAWWRKAWHETAAPRYRSGGPPPGTAKERFERLLAAVDHLADHIHEAPVWIVPCYAGPRGSGASIYPAVQNMLLAARALGLGATLTTVYLLHEREAEAAMGIGEGFCSYAILPIGYPKGKFGPVRRAPLAEVVYDGAWGRAWAGP
jgi:nitroreductase